jgi:hypothetical protein
MRKITPVSDSTVSEPVRRSGVEKGSAILQTQPEKTNLSGTARAEVVR